MVRAIALTLAVLLCTASASPAARIWARDADEALLQYLETDPADYTFEPVPGMPTLEELNITMADFWDPTFRAKHGLPDPRQSSSVQTSDPAGLEKRLSPGCYPISMSGHIQAAYACRDYLNSLGNTPCVIKNQMTLTVNCHMKVSQGEAKIMGMPINADRAETACSNVARGANWIIDNCRSANPCHCGIAGWNAAYGNGNYRVQISGA
jgi:hypothetical protein